MNQEEDFRQPEIVRDELARLHKAMATTRDLLKQYPGDPGLQFNLNSMLNRQTVLLKELQVSCEARNLDVIDLKIIADEVEDSKISLSLLGKIATSFQDLINALAYVGDKDMSQSGPIPYSYIESSRLDLIATLPGSFKIILVSHKPKDAVVKQSLDRFNDLLDSGNDQTALRNKMKVYGKRATGKYRNFLDVVYKNEAKIVFYESLKPKGFTTKEIVNEKAKNVIEVLDKAEERPQIEVDYKGILKMIDLISYDFKFLVEDSDTIIYGKYDVTLVPTIKDRLDKISICKFILTKIWNPVTESEKDDWKLVGVRE